MLKAHDLEEPDSATICETPDTTEPQKSPKFKVAAHKWLENVKRHDESNIVHDSLSLEEHSRQGTQKSQQNKINLKYLLT
jgi:hypothetical protein